MKKIIFISIILIFNLFSYIYASDLKINSPWVKSGTSVALGVNTDYIEGRLVQKNTRVRFGTYEMDFINTVPTPLWGSSGINAGVLSVLTNAGTANNPGLAMFISSTTANSGFRFNTGAFSFLIAGTEFSTFVFCMPAVISSETTIRMGFLDTTSVTAPTDGVWFEINNTTIDGRDASNTTSSTTATNYTTLTVSTCYSAKLEVNSDATSVAYYLYNSSGTQLWTNTLATNIPTATGRETGHGIVATNIETDITASNLIIMDFMEVGMTRTLTR